MNGIIELSLLFINEVKINGRVGIDPLIWASDISVNALADPGIYWGGGRTKVLNRKSRAKPESRAWSTRVSRAKPESRARSARDLRAKPKPRTKPEKKWGEGSREGARWTPPQKMFEKSNLKPFILVHVWSNFLKWLTKWLNCPLSWKIISNYLMWRNY